MRILLLITAPLLLLAFAACGDDDDSSNGSASASPTEEPSGVESGSPGATDGATATLAPTPTPSPVPTPAPTATNRTVTADRYAHILGGEAAQFLTETFPGGVPDQQPCPWDATDGIIDCSAEGFGTIALDVIPTGTVTECRALLFEGEMRAVSCNTDPPAGWIYRLEEETP